MLNVKVGKKLLKFCSRILLRAINMTNLKMTDQVLLKVFNMTSFKMTDCILKLTKLLTTLEIFCGINKTLRVSEVSKLAMVSPRQCKVCKPGLWTCPS